MKGFNNFVGTLLPSISGSAKLNFIHNGIKSAVKVSDGNLIIMSGLTTESDIEDTIAIPSLSNLAKAMRALGDFDIKLGKTASGIANKIHLRNKLSNVSLFLMNQALIKNIESNAEPLWDLSVTMGLDSMAAMKSLLGLISSELCYIHNDNNKLLLSVGNSKSTDTDSGTIVLVDEYDGEDIGMCVSSKVLAAIIGTVSQESEVSLDIFSKGMIKISVITTNDGWETSSSYYISATRE